METVFNDVEESGVLMVSLSSRAAFTPVSPYEGLNNT